MRILYQHHNCEIRAVLSSSGARSLARSIRRYSICFQALCSFQGLYETTVSVCYRF
jgi:hypothetical protein